MVHHAERGFLPAVAIANTAAFGIEPVNADIEELQLIIEQVLVQQCGDAPQQG
jgi:hypothetical protein